MRRHLKPVLLLTLLLVATIPVAADSILQGDIEGLELCPQSFCGLAVFVGGFDGSVNGLERHGAFLAGGPSAFRFASSEALFSAGF